MKNLKQSKSQSEKNRSGANHNFVSQAAAQRIPEEEELFQQKPINQLVTEDEDLLQGKFTNQVNSIQRVENSEPNKTGMPDNLKAGIENLSGIDVSDVRVHYNSSKPAQMNAHAYAQGTDIHMAPGQEKHLAHEAWHTVQQKQGRVKPTTTVNGSAVNDNVGLETEADIMGAKALQMKLDDDTERI